MHKRSLQSDHCLAKFGRYKKASDTAQRDPWVQFRTAHREKKRIMISFFLALLYAVAAMHTVETTAVDDHCFERNEFVFGCLRALRD